MSRARLRSWSAPARVRGAISIGKATAIEFAREGALVVCVARGEDGLRSVVEAIHAEGGSPTQSSVMPPTPARCIRILPDLYCVKNSFFILNLSGRC